MDETIFPINSQQDIDYLVGYLELFDKHPENFTTVHVIRFDHDIVYLDVRISYGEDFHPAMTLVARLHKNGQITISERDYIGSRIGVFLAKRESFNNHLQNICQSWIGYYFTQKYLEGLDA